MNKLNRLLQETPESYYWIGFILADGSFYKDSKYHRIDFQLQISNKDKNHLKNFCDYTGLPFKNNKKRPMVYTHSSKTEILQKIIDKFGIKLPKTYNGIDITQLENKPLNLFMCLLIGFIDGDGSITQNGTNYLELSIKLHKSWYNFLSLVSSIIPKGNLYKDKYPRFRITHYDTIINLKQYVISYKLPVLNRKWSKVNLNFESFHTKKQKVLKLYYKGKSRKEICNDLNYGYASVSRIIRLYEKTSFRSSHRS